jgi:hypothetical protein
MKLNRKDFLKSALLVAGAGFGLTHDFACSSGTEVVSGGSGGRGSGGSGSGGSGSGGSGSGGSGSGGSGSGGSGSGGSGSGGSGSGGSGSGGSGSGGNGSGGSGSGGSGSGGNGSGGEGSGGNGGRGNGNGGRGNGGGPAGSGGAGGAGSGANACDTHAPMITIGTNHPAPNEHILMLPAADITAGATKMYSIKGNSTHDHMITITAAQFTTLKSGMTYMMTSTGGGSGNHTHAVMIICA